METTENAEEDDEDGGVMVKPFLFGRFVDVSTRIRSFLFVLSMRSSLEDIGVRTS